MKCPACRNETLEVRRENHRYDESGLKNVTLVDLEIRYCRTCGGRFVSIPKIEELHQVIAFAVAGQRARLTGAEIRFLRKYLGWSGEDFAALMGVTPSTASRWENDKEPMGGQADRLLRAFVFRMRPVEEYPNEKFAEVAQDGISVPRFALRVQGGGWLAEEAAA